MKSFLRVSLKTDGLRVGVESRGKRKGKRKRGDVYRISLSRPPFKCLE